MKKQRQQIQKISPHVQFQTVSPATKLLEKRRKMYEVHEAFEVQKQQFKKQQQTFKGVEEDIRKRDLQIQIHLINFCQFLQQNDAKRKKAEERYNQEQEIYKKKEEEIAKLDQEINIATLKLQKFEKKVESLKKYQKYLESVRNTYSDEFPEMSDILSRYQTLKKFNQKLLKQRDAMEEAKQKLKKQSSTFEKQMNQSILQLSNQQKDLSKRLESKMNAKQDLQSQLQRSRDQYERRNLDMAKTLMAIDNLYNKCSEGTVKIKHNHEEYADEVETKKNNKKKPDDKTKKKQATAGKLETNKQDEENNVEYKCRVAIQKVRSIFSYAKDYRNIIDQYKKSIVEKQKKGA